MTAGVDPLLGRELEGRYRLEARLGEGGLGVVYRARHLRLGRQFAVKVLQPEYAENAALRARFEREAKALGALSHPGVVGVTDFGIDGKAPFLVMELLEGETLEEAMPLLPERGLCIVRDVLSAVAYAHGMGLVHRDLKPANVFLERLPDGMERVRVLDFGLAKFLDDPGEGSVLTRPGATLGTPAYMPPEQALGTAASPRSDVYALGILLFEVLAGARPFDGQGGELMRQHLLVPIPSLRGRSADLDALAIDALDELVRRAAGKIAVERFADAGQMRAALDAILRLPSGPYPQRAARAPTPVSAVAPTAHAESGPAGPTIADSARRPAKPAAPTLPTAPDATVRDDKPVVEVTPAPLMINSKPPPGRPEPAPAPSRSNVGFVLAVLLFIGLAGLAFYVPRLLEDAETPTPAPAPSGPAPAPVADAPSAPAEPDAGEPDAPVAFPALDHDPWLEPLPAELERFRARVERGEPLGDGARAALRLSARHAPGDPRAWLLMGHADFAAGARSDAMDRYERAMEISAGARYDPAMLTNLITMAAHQTVGDRAAGLVVRFYGRDALSRLREVRVDLVETEEIERLDQLGETLSALPPTPVVP